MRMVLLLIAVSLIIGMVFVRRGVASEGSPPRAEIIPHEFQEHGGTRTDNYYWLKERESEEVIDYLTRENEYAENVMSHTTAMQKVIFEEIKERYKKDDSSVPYLDNEYFYYERFEQDLEFAFQCRKKGSLDAPEQIVIDENALAEGHHFFRARSASVSPDGHIAAYGIDTKGRRFYTIHFKDLVTGESLPDLIPDVTGQVVWSNDNRHVFYSRQEPSTLRWYQIWRHEVGSETPDVLVYEEKDDTFWASIGKTRSERYIIIHLGHTLSTEIRYLDADDPFGEFRIFQTREMGHEYSIEHLGDRFFILSNRDAKNFRIMETPVGRTGEENWKEVIPHYEDVLLEDMLAFEKHLVIKEWKEGLIRMRIVPLDGGEHHFINFGEPAYNAWFDENPGQDTELLRIGYTSLNTPESVFRYDMTTRSKELLKQTEILGGFDRDNYVTERLWAEARDGTAVPISIVYRKGMKRDGSSPLYLYAYGSYGGNMTASFRSYRLSLIDRGVTFAIAHVRGGAELGRAWYEDGRQHAKKNTFRDFIDCAEHLIAEGYTSSDRLYAVGGSAGGLLVGVVINDRPDLFHGAIASMPFVDVVTTMFDSSIPLTTSEYDEWGNPNIKEDYDYMLSYSPYDNVSARDYPNLLVTTGLHDSQVQYWEPAKWVAKLRAYNTSDNRILLKTNMEAGHHGTMGRFARHEETAFEYAFILDLAGLLN